MRKPRTRSNGYQVRKPCGCYSSEGGCDCSGLLSPDPWLVAGEDINLNRLAETRNYRQAKFRKV